MTFPLASTVAGKLHPLPNSSRAIDYSPFTRVCGGTTLSVAPVGTLTADPLSRSTGCPMIFTRVAATGIVEATHGNGEVPTTYGHPEIANKVDATRTGAPDAFTRAIVGTASALPPWVHNAVTSLVSRYPIRRSPAHRRLS